MAQTAVHIMVLVVVMERYHDAAGIESILIKHGCSSFFPWLLVSRFFACVTSRLEINPARKAVCGALIGQQEIARDRVDNRATGYAGQNLTLGLIVVLRELNSFEGRMLLMADHGVPLAQLPCDSEC